MAKQSQVKIVSPALPLLVGLTAGVLAALVVDVQLAAKDMSVATAWSQLVGGEPVRFASASALWAIAGIAFVAGAITAALLGKYPPPWRDQRVLRWIVGVLILFGLAHVAHGVSTPHGIEPGSAALAEISAIAVAAIMALFGAFFARPR